MMPSVWYMSSISEHTCPSGMRVSSIFASLMTSKV
jgi:hypothetical protein